MTEIIEAFPAPADEPFVETYPEFVARHWGRHQVTGPEIGKPMCTRAAAFANLAAALVCSLPGRPDFDQRMSICGLRLLSTTGAVTDVLAANTTDSRISRKRLETYLSDVLFYFTALSQYADAQSDLCRYARNALHALIGQCGFTLADVERANIEKLERP